ncbi:transglycosylase SLT domain-containing protein [Streptosporangium sp. NPDC023963]|uniref:aggregation-promoting factor C-terminal-like domain-containing protein n=1 Tax=Streptosporangium sp. NPDC023963 TaxID=3155608 RepID=UPI003430F243
MSTLRRTGVLVITSVLALGTTTVAQASSARPGNQAVARPMVSAHGWNNSQFACLSRLWTRESNWNHRARNRSSGAYGIPQALPGGKMASAGRDWRTNPRTQIRWGLGYIKQRYGSPCRAWAHFTTRGWY